MGINSLNNQLKQAVLSSSYKDKNIVYGLGPKEPCLALIGEAPGGEEERHGLPFIGKAGKNLTEFLEAVGLLREEIYITNAVKIRTSKISSKTGKALNRTPNKDDIEFFNPFLHKELEIIKPGLIVTLGNIPLKAVSGENLSIGDWHGKIINTGRYNNIFALYHPAAIIYNQSLKVVYDQDMKRLAECIRKTDNQ